jgi:hypothetical protein
MKPVIFLDSVNVYYLLDDRTIDAHMNELIAPKRSTLEQATGDSKPQKQEVDAMALAHRLGGLEGHRAQDDATSPQEDIEQTVAILGSPK